MWPRGLTRKVTAVGEAGAAGVRRWLGNGAAGKRSGYLGQTRMDGEKMVVDDESGSWKPAVRPEESVLSWSELFQAIDLNARLKRGNVWLKALPQ